MKIEDVVVRDTPRGASLTATVSWGADSRAPAEMLFRDTPAELVTAPGDALLTASLVTGMALREDVSVDAPVSRRLLEAVPHIVDFFALWLPRLHRSRVSAESHAVPTAGSEVGSTFSGGVDSFYTILRPRDDPITCLVTTLPRGADGIPPNVERHATTLRYAAASLGKRHVVAETTLMPLWRSLVPHREEHGNLHWGPSMIAPALALGGLLRRFHVAASWGHEPVPPWNSHPELDPLWSTEQVEIRHDGIVSRERKVPLVAASEIAMRTLQVCPHDASLPLNCGRCVKCIGTMVILHNSGVADRAVTFPPLEPDAVRRVFVTEPWREQFERLRLMTTDAALRDALAQALRRTAVRRRLHPLGRVLRRLGLRR